MDITVVTVKGGPETSIEGADAIFGVEFKEPLVHQVVNAYLAGGRSGTSSQKNRSAVRGGGSKPWRQKGTGRARAGTIRSPIWKGGGRAFPATSRSYAQKVNRKMYRAAIRSIISELVREDRFKVCDDIQLDRPKTKLLANLLSTLNVTGQTLIVTPEYTQNITLAARNLPSVEVQQVSQLNPVALVGSETVLFTSTALRELEKLLQ